MKTSITPNVALACVLALGAANAGCSFIFVESVPSDHARLAYFDCTSTYGLSVADGFFALSGGIAAGSALSQSKQEYADKNNGASRNAAVGGDLAVAGVMAASAVYGIVQATRCDHAKEALRARILGSPLHPPPPAMFPTAPYAQPPYGQQPPDGQPPLPPAPPGAQPSPAQQPDPPPAVLVQPPQPGSAP